VLDKHKFGNRRRAGVFEFLVDSLDDAWHVIGRNGDRDIPVGTTFTTVRRCRVHREANGYRTEELGEAGRVALTLREVHWYGRSIDAVPRGHTAALAVTGDGLRLLSGLLDKLSPDEYLWLVAPECQGAEKGTPLFSPALQPDRRQP